MRLHRTMRRFQGEWRVGEPKSDRSRRLIELCTRVLVSSPCVGRPIPNSPKSRRYRGDSSLQPRNPSAKVQGEPRDVTACRPLSGSEDRSGQRLDAVAAETPTRSQRRSAFGLFRPHNRRYSSHGLPGRVPERSCCVDRCADEPVTEDPDQEVHEYGRAPPGDDGEAVCTRTPVGTRDR
jgi:hypothetical protein